MNRVVVTIPFIANAGVFGLCLMQVCAVKDATDKEILEVCNEENPSGTSNGWTEVVRKVDEASPFRSANKLPVTCADDPERRHFMILC